MASLKIEGSEYPSMTALGFVSNMHCCSVAKAGWDESHLWLATGCCPAGPALRAAPFHTVVTYRLTFMAQHALDGLSGSRPSGAIEQWARRCSRTTVPACPGLSLAGRAKLKCARFCHRENKIEMHCALCLWKLPSVNTWVQPFVKYRPCEKPYIFKGHYMGKTFLSLLYLLHVNRFAS